MYSCLHACSPLLIKELLYGLTRVFRPSISPALIRHFTFVENQNLVNHISLRCERKFPNFDMKISDKKI